MERRSVRIVQLSWTLEWDRASHYGLDVSANRSVRWDYREHAQRQPTAVMHVFGAVADGRKACVNIRGVHPYLYIPALRFFYEVRSQDELCVALGTLAEKIDHELNKRATKPNGGESGGGGAGVARRHVAHIELVSGRPFYGYYEEEAPFFRIDLFNPLDLRRAAALFQNGVLVPNQNCPVYNAHVPYEMQFLIDHSLFGMNWLRFSYETPDSYSDRDREHERFSTCELEFDIEVSQILNTDMHRSRHPTSASAQSTEKTDRSKVEGSDKTEGSGLAAGSGESEFELGGLGVYDATLVAQFQEFKNDLHTLVQTISARRTQSQQQAQVQTQLQVQTEVQVQTQPQRQTQTPRSQSAAAPPAIAEVAGSADVSSILPAPASASQTSLSSALDFSFSETDFINSTVRLDGPCGTAAAHLLAACDPHASAAVGSQSAQNQAQVQPVCRMQQETLREADEPTIRVSCNWPDVNTDDDVDELNDDEMMFILNASRTHRRAQREGHDSDSDTAPESDTDADAEVDAAGADADTEICASELEQAVQPVVNTAGQHGQLEDSLNARLSSPPLLAQAASATTVKPTTQPQVLAGCANASQVIDIEDLVAQKVTPSAEAQLAVNAIVSAQNERRREPQADDAYVDLTAQSDMSEIDFTGYSSASSFGLGDAASFSSPSSFSPVEDGTDDDNSLSLSHDGPGRRRVGGQFDGNDDSLSSSPSSSSSRQRVGYAPFAAAKHRSKGYERAMSSSAESSNEFESEMPPGAQAKPARSVFCEDDTRFHNLSWMRYVRQLEAGEKRELGAAAQAHPNADDRVETTEQKRRRIERSLECADNSEDDDQEEDEIVEITPLVPPPKLDAASLYTTPKMTMRTKVQTCINTQSQSQSQPQPNAPDSETDDEDEASLHVSLNLGNSTHVASENRRVRQNGNNLTAFSLELLAELRYLDAADALPTLTATGTARDSEMDMMHWLRWQPETDPIRVVSYCVFNDLRDCVATAKSGVILVDDFSNASDTDIRRRCIDTFVKPTCTLTLVRNEHELIDRVVQLVHEHDPDILIGYELERASWGYLIERARFLQRGDTSAETHIVQRLARRRVRERKTRSRYATFVRDSLDRLQMADELSGCSNRSLVHGRMMLNLWRIVRALREEQPVGKLRSFTFECVCERLFAERMPSFGRLRLTHLWRTALHSPTCPALLKQAAVCDCATGDTRLINWRMLDYLLAYVRVRSDTTARLCAKLRLFQRTAEFARLYGIEFAEALTRGSQFRVESVMLRIAHRFGLLPFSASRNDLHQQAPPSAVPLNLEPQSAYYREPVCVLDFQSLYPSVMIAFNHCYSTVIGRLTHLHCRVREMLALVADETVDPSMLSLLTTIELGCRRSHVVDLAGLHNFIFGGIAPGRDAAAGTGKRQLMMAPNGVLFYPASVRKGVLPILLESLLGTRVLLKERMQRAKAAGRRERAVLYDIRQLALKLLANVVFGYTAATFTGRSSCVDISDSTVSSSRLLLERTIELVEHIGARGLPPSLQHLFEPAERAELEALCAGCRVVYGDTDSCFVELRGRSVEQALRAGRQLAVFVSRVNAKSPPIRLKFERVYSRCLLETKKRYFGYAVESEADIGSALLDAKGIETIRTDQCGLVQEMLECAIRTLFDTDSLSAVRDYLQRQFTQLLACRAACHGARRVGDAMHLASMRIERFVFWREFHGVDRYVRRLDAPVPSVEVIRKRVRMLTSLLHTPTGLSREAIAKLTRRVAPLRKEKVPYMIVSRNATLARRLRDARGSPFISCVLEPLEALHCGLMPDVRYYLDRQLVPALNRFVLLVDPLLTAEPHTLGYSVLQADCSVWLNEVELECGHSEQNRPASPDPTVADGAQLPRAAVHVHLARYAHQRFDSARTLLLANICQSCMRLPRTCAMLPIAAADDDADQSTTGTPLSTQRSQLACQAVDCPVLYRYYLHC